MPAEVREIHRFRDFELDPNACELRCNGRIVHLERIPLELLSLLVERSGQIVTREEILGRIWGKGVFIDIESSINTAVRKIRRALDDDAEAPRFIATVPAKGYRFIAAAYDPASQAILIRRSDTAFPDHKSKVAESRDGPTGERRRLTVLFCDLMNSTSLAAQHDPDEWWETVADYHRAAVQAIERYGGHVGQYRGDGVMAHFGWPQAQEHDAEHAVRAGLAILEAISKLNDHSTARPRPSPRIGIDSGAVMVEAGAGKDADLFGEPPDRARRMEAAADPGTVLITAETHRLVSGLFVVEDRGAHCSRASNDRPNFTG